VHIIENRNLQVGKTYCYIAECLWDKQTKKYVNPRVAIGYLEGEPPEFVPNRYFMSLERSLGANPTDAQKRDKLIIDTVESKYSVIREAPNHKKQKTKPNDKVQTAWAVFSGPSIVFGGITQKYRIDKILQKAFGESDAQEILSLAWYLVSEGDALSNSDAWLCHYETPAGGTITSQEVTRLLDRMNQDGIMTFYKAWLNSLMRTDDKVLYDLTSISWYGQGINMAGWGYNRDKEKLPQINFALMCARNSGMPLFAWPLEGSISDVSTLQNTMQFLKKLDYKPNCIMMDRAFGSIDNISFMLNQGYTFLQALRVNAKWIRDIIDNGRETRLRPDSMIKTEERVYYASTTMCQWVTLNKTNKKGIEETEFIVHQCKETKKDKYIAQDGETLLSQHPCVVHVLYCQDLVGSQWDEFMERLNIEYGHLTLDETASPPNDLKKYFIIERKKWARKRNVEFNMEAIAKHRNNYAGFVCFISNDKTIRTAKEALNEYSTRDYIEKDFDEMKNELDMNRIRVHTDNRMKARLLIQFVAEIIIREIRVKLRNSEECRKFTRKQITSHIKGIYKIRFKNKYKDVCPELSKSQRLILDALGFEDSR
jgi:transposase